MKKKTITLMLVMLLVSAYINPVLASTTELNNDKNIISPMYTYISEARSRLQIDSGGKATVETYLSGNSKVTSTKATIRLQQYKGGNWTTIKTWNERNNSRILDFDDTYAVSSGYEYRVQSTVTAYSGSQSESITVTSNIQRY
ncbi:hypothetical protein [Paratissierella segnis]|uniref:DUF5626 domain-containing protein n=1 Tax=Paratissierella segnis TaxID=2763679 RepID=A0A926EXQ1_9FIRM|nr:hypothetical protein [Paratissierella segnis]MBC8589472.1 hypothetical protein [Paratissierella segnis]